MSEQFNPNLSMYFEEQASKRLWFLLSLNRLHNVTLNMFDKSMAHERYVPLPLQHPTLQQPYYFKWRGWNGDLSRQSVVSEGELLTSHVTD